MVSCLIGLNSVISVCTNNNIYFLLVKSNPVKLDTSRTLIRTLTPTVSEYCLNDCNEPFSLIFRKLMSLESHIELKRGKEEWDRCKENVVDVMKKTLGRYLIPILRLFM